ncbi:MAG: hypothetical protein ACQEQV_03005 [Fibrobacterota bacterium]
MNLSAVKAVIIITCVAASCVAALTLQDAYSHYLQQDYAESLDLYTRIYRRDSIPDALYGIMNSLMAQKKYRTALHISEKGDITDPVLAGKRIYCMTVTGRAKSGKTYYASLSDLSGTDRMNIALSAGWGCYNRDAYACALQWFRRAQEAAPGENAALANALSTARKAVEAMEQNTVSVFGGAALYSADTVHEKNQKYVYSHGAWAGGEYIRHLKNGSRLTISAGRYYASFEKSIYAGDTIYEGDTVYSGTALYGIDVDTLVWSLDTQFTQDGYSVQYKKDSLSQAGYTLDTVIPWDTTYNQISFSDTAWYYYKTDSLGEADGISQETLGSYDALDSVHWKDTIHWKDTAHWADTIQPEDIVQDNLYIAWNTDRFGAGINLFSSTMEDFEKSILLYSAFNPRPADKIHLIAAGAYTISPHLHVVQLNPRVIFKPHSRIRLFLEPTYIWKAKDTRSFPLPGTQYSLYGGIKLRLTRLEWRAAGIIGECAFAAQQQGKSQLSLTTPHRGSAEIKAVWQLFQNRPIYLFGTGRYEAYSQFNRTLLSGGITALW